MIGDAMEEIDETDPDYAVWLPESEPAPARGGIGEEGGEQGREGARCQADEVFDAWQTFDIERMVAAERLPTNPIDRHFLLLRICEITYQRRREPSMRALFLQYASKHVSEFAQLATPLRADMRPVLDGGLPRVPTFQQLATVLTEDGDFQGAAEVCRTALRFDLHDNTISGFEGRIERIRKAEARSAKAKLRAAAPLDHPKTEAELADDLRRGVIDDREFDYYGALEPKAPGATSPGGKRGPRK